MGINPNGTPYTFKGSISSIFIFVSLLNRSPFLKDRIFTPMSKFFPLREDAFWEGFVAKGRKEEVAKLVFIFEKMLEIFTLKFVSLI